MEEGGAGTDSRGEGAGTSLGSAMAGPDRQRRILSTKKLHLFFEGFIFFYFGFILASLSAQHVQTVGVLPFLKAC